MRAEVFGVDGNGFFEEVGCFGVFLALKGFEARGGRVLGEEGEGKDNGQHFSQYDAGAEKRARSCLGAIETARILNLPNQDYTGKMTSRIEQIETEIMQLSSEELDAFRAWFADYDFEAWDRQIEADCKTGKLNHIAEKIKRDYELGLTTEL